MIDLSEILNKAFAYTKSHKFLWFFGFFLTGWGMMNFVRRVDLDPELLLRQIKYYWYIAQLRPGLVTIIAIVSVLILIGMGILGAIARSVIIYSGLHLERREEVNFKVAVKGTDKQHWRVFWTGFIVNAAIFFILAWLAVPLYFVFRPGVGTRGVLLILCALAIFIPIIIILSLVNIFSACYIVVYNFKVWQAIRASFDILAGFAEKTATLFAILFIIYFALIFFSATVTGLFGAVAYHLFILLKAGPAHAILGILVVLTSVLLIAINSILNVFTNFAWTLFFLKIVKVKFIEEGAVAARPLA